MAEKRFIVLGLGSFGTSLALRLSENGCRVTGIDRSEARVEAIKDRLHEALSGDVTDRSVLEQLMLSEAEGVFISLGESIERSVLAALHAKELGTKRLYVKGVSLEHGKILKKLEVDRIIYPEQEIAEQTADDVTYPNVLEHLSIDPEYSIAEVVVPQILVGKNLAEVKLPQEHNLIVLAVKEVLASKWLMNPRAKHTFTDEQLLLVMGRKEDVNKFSELK